MKIAISCFKYFPYGGLQQDMLLFAEQAVSEGHDVTVFTLSWYGHQPAWLTIRIVPVRAWRNHKRYAQFSQYCRHSIAVECFDIHLGFNKMAGLHWYYAADPCYADKIATQKPWWYRFTARAHFFQQAEQAVFGQTHQVKILVSSDQLKKTFQQVYNTPNQRFVHLPPAIHKKFATIRFDNDIMRDDIRAQFTSNKQAYLLLSIGSGFKTKGLDRTITAIAALPQVVRTRTVLVVAGHDNARPFKQLSARYNVAEQIHFLGGVDDIIPLLLASDCLVHPARSEAGGKVLLEALLAGLPVLASSVCGFASIIRTHPAVHLLPHTFELKYYTDKLTEIMSGKLRFPERAAIRQEMLIRADTFNQPQTILRAMEANDSYAIHH